MLNPAFAHNWAGMELLRIASNRVDGFNFPIRVEYDQGRSWFRVQRPPFDKQTEPLCVDLSDWEPPSTVTDSTCSDLVERLRLALLERQPVIWWNA